MKHHIKYIEKAVPVSGILSLPHARVFWGGFLFVKG